MALEFGEIEPCRRRERQMQDHRAVRAGVPDRDLIMTHQADALLPEYAKLLPMMRVTNSGLINPVAAKLVSIYRNGQYGAVPQKTGIPLLFIAPSFEREASSNFSRSPAQGDRWDRPSVNVPRGRGPFDSWEDAALDAYHLNRLDQVGAANWTWPLLCYYGELFNGEGYRDYYHMRSPYLWGGTNLQQIGKYTSDGKFDAGHFDTQPGIVPLAMRIAQLEPALAQEIPGAWPFALGPASNTAPPSAPSPVAGHDIFAIQRALAAAGFDPGPIDGSFGRKTSTAVRAFEASRGFSADGLLDPQTVAALVGTPSTT
jgi:lysozyme family protein